MPRSMIKAFYDMGVKARHAWGMTEMSPIGTLAALNLRLPNSPARPGSNPADFRAIRCSASR